MARIVNVLYSKARVRKGELNRPNFEQALRATLNTQSGGNPISSDAAHRRFDGAPEYGTLVMNHVDIMQRGLFIEMVRFAPGSRIPLIRTGTGGSEYALQNADTPRGTDLVRGFIYALVLGDHFLYVNREVALVRNEQFMEWFISSKTRIATSDISISFTPEVNIAELPSVEKLVVRPKEPSDSAMGGASAAGRGSTSSRAASERLAGSDVFEILRAAHFTDSRIAALEAQGVDIEVKLEVFFKSDGVRHEISRNDIADLLREAPEKEITLYSKAGRERQGNIKRVSFPIEVETVGELFDRRGMAGALWSALRYFQREGYV